MFAIIGCHAYSFLLIYITGNPGFLWMRVHIIPIISKKYEVLTYAKQTNTVPSKQDASSADIVIYIFNSLLIGKCSFNVKLVIFTLLNKEGNLSISSEIAIRWMSQGSTDSVFNLGFWNCESQGHIDFVKSESLLNFLSL